MKDNYHPFDDYVLEGVQRGIAAMRTAKEIYLRDKDKRKPKWVKQVESVGIKVCPSVYTGESK